MTTTRPMFAMLCANNVNRSTEAHDPLHAAGLRVCSFGAGNRVRFPGPSRDDPRIYEFSTPYATMYRELQGENGELCVLLLLVVSSCGAVQTWLHLSIDVVEARGQRLVSIVDGL